VRRKLIAAAVLVIGGAYATLFSRSVSYVAGGSDSSGYLNEARMIAAGRVEVPIEPMRTMGVPAEDDLAWPFAPLGFRPSTNFRNIVPTYPPGFPVHLMLAALIGGWARAPFLVAPMAAMISIVLLFVVARQLGLSTEWGLAACAILAVWPVFVAQGMQPYSDDLATMWTLASIACALAADRRPAWSTAAGAAFAIGVAVRPTNILLALPLAIALRWKPSRLALAAVAAAPFAVALMWWNARLYGSPLTTGYGSLASAIAWMAPRERIPFYTHFLILHLTPLVFPGGLFVVFDRRAGWRALLVSWFLVFFIFYCFYPCCDDWTSTRFLLPAIPALIIGLMFLLRDWSRTVVACALVAVMVTVGAYQTVKLGVLNYYQGETIYPGAVQWTERQLPRNALLVTMQFSGAFFYYSHRFTARWDYLDRGRFELLRAYAGNANLRWYALLAPFEVDQTQQLAPGVSTPNGKGRDVTLFRLDS
jgi:hypothetical protein